METKEVKFSGFKMNGFLAIFLFLFVWAGVTVWCFMQGQPLFPDFITFLKFSHEPAL